MCIYKDVRSLVIGLFALSHAGCALGDHRAGSGADPQSESEVGESAESASPSVRQAESEIGESAESASPSVEQSEGVSIPSEADRRTEQASLEEQVVRSRMPSKEEFMPHGRLAPELPDLRQMMPTRSLPVAVLPTSKEEAGLQAEEKAPADTENVAEAIEQPAASPDLEARQQRYLNELEVLRRDMVDAPEQERAARESELKASHLQDSEEVAP